jgi:4-hydroxy-2-oxoheptanedioate aldolase
MPHQAFENARDHGIPALGGVITLPSEALVGCYERAGYDFVGFDCQHGSISAAEAAAIVRRMGTSSLATLVRVADGSAASIGHALDAGADGVIVPLVDTAEQAADAVAACRYPARGVRSFGPTRPGLPLDTEALESRASCFVMVETREGLDHVAEICAVDGVSGIVVGPGDLPISLGLNPLAGFTTDQLFEPLGRIRAACDEHRLLLGVFALDAVTTLTWLEQGCRLVMLGMDHMVISQAFERELAVARGRIDEPLDSPYRTLYDLK